MTIARVADNRRLLEDRTRMGLCIEAAYEIDEWAYKLAEAAASIEEPCGLRYTLRGMGDRLHTLATAVMAGIDDEMVTTGDLRRIVLVEMPTPTQTPQLAKSEDRR